MLEKPWSFRPAPISGWRPRPASAPPRPLAPTYLPRIPFPRGRPLGPHPTRCPRPPGRGCPAAAPPLQTAWGWGTGRTLRGPGSAGGQGHLQSGGPLFSFPLLLALAFLLPGPKWYSQLGLQPAPWPQFRSPWRGWGKPWLPTRARPMQTTCAGLGSRACHPPPPLTPCLCPPIGAMGQ